MRVSEQDTLCVQHYVPVLEQDTLWVPPQQHSSISMRLSNAVCPSIPSSFVCSMAAAACHGASAGAGSAAAVPHHQGE